MFPSAKTHQREFGLTGSIQALATEGEPDQIRVCVLYPGRHGHQLGCVFLCGAAQREPTVPAHPLPPQQVADLIAWTATAPPQLVLNEVTITPLHEQGCP